MVFEGHATMEDCFGELPEWNDVVEVAKRGQKIAADKEERLHTLLADGFKGTVRATGNVGEAVVNLSKLMGKVFGK